MYQTQKRSHNNAHDIKKESDDEASITISATKANWNTTGQRDIKKKFGEAS
jgi:hypothetical protein